MLEQTFCHIHGIGEKNERELWDQQICSWQDLREQHPLPLSEQKSKFIRRCIQESTRQLHRRNARYFCDQLPSNLQWRLFPHFQDSVAYLDIETTGTSWDYDKITTICVYDGSETHAYVQGQNLEQFVTDITNYKLLITYNGKRFDIPFIERYFDITMPQAHIDLHHVLGSLGYRGGLKSCEKQLGLDRKGLADVSGLGAIQLWHEYTTKDNPAALDTLLAYNALDVINLATIMAMAYNKNLEGSPFEESHRLEVPRPPDQPPYPIDSNLVRLISAS